MIGAQGPHFGSKQPRSAAGKQQDLLERGEQRECLKGEHEQDWPPDHGYDDMADGLQGRGPVHLGGGQVISRDGLDGRGEDHQAK